MTGIFSLAAAIIAREEKKSAPTSTLEFALVYQEHFRFVWRTLRGLGVQEAAIDDAAQEVFLVVYRKLHTVTEPAGIKTWIFNICRRVASDQRRSATRKGATMEYNDGATSDISATPHDQLESRQMLVLVEEYMEKLDEENRSIFVLSEIEELPVPQIAQMLDMNLNTIYSRLKNIRNDLVTHMAKKSGLKAGRE